MLNNALAGKFGSVMVAASLLANIKDWKFDQTADTADITNFGSASHKEFLATLDGASGSFTGQWAIIADTTGQAVLTIGATVALKLYVSVSHYYSCSAIINKISSGATVDKEVTVDFSFQVTGAVSIV